MRDVSKIILPALLFVLHARRGTWISVSVCLCGSPSYQRTLLVPLSNHSAHKQTHGWGDCGCERNETTQVALFGDECFKYMRSIIEEHFFKANQG